MVELEILYEDNHLLVINKPAGLATMGVESGPTVHRIACRYIAEKYAKPGKVFLGIVHRLDSMSSGVLILARTSKAASRLSEQFRKTDGGPQKIYLAAVEGDVVPTSDTLRDWIVKNESAHRMEVATPAMTGAVEAELRYRVLRNFDAGGQRSTLLAIRLITGRKHQIRVQFSARGQAVIGDVKYGAAQQRMRGIALHAWSLTIEHPTKATPLTFRAEPPQSWGKWRPTTQEMASLDQLNLW